MLAATTNTDKRDVNIQGFSLLHNFFHFTLTDMCIRYEQY